MMLASGEYPDIMEIDFYNHPGGPNKAISDGYIIALNDYMQYAPNLVKYLEEHPEVDKMCKTDDGTYYAFPFIRGDKSLIVFSGLMLRKDWLDDLGLEVPTTIDEWHTVLTAFKNEKGAEAPLSFLISSLKTSAAFAGAFDVRSGLYVDNGVVKYGEAEPGYKEFITTMRQWYSEGLIDKNVATLDSKILDSNVLDGKTGAMIGNVGGGMGKWVEAMKSIDPEFELVAAPYPSLNEGERVRFGQYDNMVQAYGSASISSTCQDVELAMRYLDYGYSEEGHMLFNFGEEGVSYNMVDGYPQYTDLSPLPLDSDTEPVIEGTADDADVSYSKEGNVTTITVSDRADPSNYTKYLVTVKKMGAPLPIRTTAAAAAAVKKRFRLPIL